MLTSEERKRIISIAETEIGYSEDPADSNQTKYGEWFGLNGVAWCAIFVSWLYNQVGKPLPNIGFEKGMAGCQTAVAYFKKSGEVTGNPEPGDIVFFDWNKDGRYDHTGIFVQWKDTGFETIEGNTSNMNDSNGGSVMKRFRKLNSNHIFVKVK